MNLGIKTTAVIWRESLAFLWGSQYTEHKQELCARQTILIGLNGHMSASLHLVSSYFINWWYGYSGSHSTSLKTGPGNVCLRWFLSCIFAAQKPLVNTDPIRLLSQSSAAPLGVTHPPETLVSLSLWSRADRPAAAGLPRCFSTTKSVSST